MKYYLLIVFFILNIRTEKVQLKSEVILQKDLDECKWYYDSLFQTKIYTTTTQSPEFNGGKDMLYRFIHNKIRVSSSEIIDSQGQVLSEFIIDLNGNIVGAKIYCKKEEDYTTLDRKVLDIITKMPKWFPAKCGEETVSYLYKLPIVF